ncbi:uncharacterized protein LOC115627690 [Scaptodrosophila lebanonensis]|uniref:Uncharacterized protein LOC115627690 n=1 Tax=Drosophila lebanonensis TaxID=7225 RepID=A0A6J2TVW5_DROLE|nr:uncharacterized protein LOC115627690 [Scaptodrosophila lebanonensis]
MSPAQHQVTPSGGASGPVAAQAENDFELAASTGGDKWKDVPDRYFLFIAHFLAGNVNDTEAMDRFNGPILKASIKSVYWLFLIQYAALALLGVIMNIVIIVYILYHRLYKDVTHAFIINLAFCHFVQCALVLPVSLMVMLIQNWIFGQFLCFFLPMLQDIPLHVAMISHILIAWDRMRWLNDPLRGRLPGFVCCCATWLTGMVIALPYPIYTIYVELGDYMKQLSGMGLCLVNLMDDMHEYTRGLFLLMYCGPAILLSYLYIRTSQELRPPDGPFAVMMYEHRADLRMRQRNSSTTSTSGGERTLSGGGVAGLTTVTSHSNGGTGGGSSAQSRSYDLYSAEMDVRREKRKQRNFGSMAAAQVVCVCPLMVLRFARLSLEETYENQKHFDFTYLMFVWVAFLPTVIFPCIYASQILPRNEQERLRGYLRLSSKRKKKARRSDAGESGAPGGSSRENSIEKDEHTNTTTVLANGAHGPNAGDVYSEPNKQTKSARSHELRHERHAGDRYSGAPYRQAQSHGANKERVQRAAPLSGGRGAGDAGVVNNLGKDIRSKKHDVKINIISDGQGPHSMRHGKLMSSSSNSSRKSAHARHSGGGGGVGLGVAEGAGSGRKLTIESLDNNSVSNITASTYCNGNSTLLDDSSTSNYGDGEESSVVSSIMMPNSAHLATRWHATGNMRHKDVSFSECSSTFSRMDSSSSTLERDLEIIDLLERERSMDIQDMMEREKHGEKVRTMGGAGRQLPDIEKLYAQRSPKPTRDSYGYEKALTKNNQLLSTSVLPGSDPLSISHSTHSSQPTESYSLSSTLNEEEMPLPRDELLLQRMSLHDDMVERMIVDEEEEEVPQDFYDNYTPGASNNMPIGSNLNGKPLSTAVAAAAAPPVPPPAYQYQYTRRLSRKSSHHSVGVGSSHHRGSKRDSFNSLNGSDLIAGAFCELDPTQPLNKMSVIDSRMRRSSPRNSSFSSSSARSSMKSRDYGHGSTHSAHPELDFRENIFAEL